MLRACFLFAPPSVFSTPRAHFRENRLSFSRIISRSHSSLYEHSFQHQIPPFKALPNIPSLLLPSRVDNQIPPNRRTTRLFLSLVVSPTPSLRSAALKLHLFTITENSFLFGVHFRCEDAKSAPVSSEVDERQNIGRLASPIHEEINKCNPCEIFSLSNRKFHAHHPA